MISRIMGLIKRPIVKPEIAKDSQLNVYNIAAMRSQKPDSFDFIRFDSINNCNVKCVYCHNHRSNDQVETDDLKSFLGANVLGVCNFQMGCIMEPTMDRRMADLLQLIANSKAKPTQSFILQTNGILLHQHDTAKIRDAGVSHLQVSIDSAVPEINDALRGRTNLDNIKDNLIAFRKVCPVVELAIVSTITRLNVESMESLVKWGLDIGATNFVMREVFYVPENDMVNHSKMPNLLLMDGDFAAMVERLKEQFDERVNFHFADAGFLNNSGKKIKIDSFR